MDIRFSLKIAVGTLITLLLVLMHPAAVRAEDPLPSWSSGAAKEAIIAFVGQVTAENTPGFIPPEERIAVFDNDGTLWPENPVPFQLAFAIDEVRRLMDSRPELKEDPMVKALLAGDFATLLAGRHHDGLLHIVALTHAGMTTEEFARNVQSWIASARHPTLGAPYDQLTYQPMQEVLRYLRANGFKTFIVSGGGADFMRAWSDRVYGIPPEQVVGSTNAVRYELRNGMPALVKTMDHVFIDDKAGKPAGIHQFIGRRPVAVFGNSDGDKEMLEYGTVGNPRPSLGVIVHHTDGAREFEYDAKPKSSGKLEEALKDAAQRGWVVVSMKHDWKTIFSRP